MNLTQFVGMSCWWQNQRTTFGWVCHNQHSHLKAIWAVQSTDSQWSQARQARAIPLLSFRSSSFALCHLLWKGTVLCPCKSYACDWHTTCQPISILQSAYLWHWLIIITHGAEFKTRPCRTRGVLVWGGLLTLWEEQFSNEFYITD